MQVVIIGPDAQVTAAAWEAEGATVIAAHRDVALDVRDAWSREGFVGCVREYLGRIDVLVVAPIVDDASLWLVADGVDRVVTDLLPRMAPGSTVVAESLFDRSLPRWRQLSPGVRFVVASASPTGA